MGELIMRDTGGDVCWCGAHVWTHSTARGEHLNAKPSDAEHMVPLAETLRLAVPLHIAEIRSQNLTSNQFHARLSKAATDIGQYGDLLMYGGGKSAKSRGHLRDAFNSLAYGIAVASMQPGGIHYGGIHWEHTPAMEPAEPPKVPAPRSIVTVPLPDNIPARSEP